MRKGFCREQITTSRLLAGATVLAAPLMWSSESLAQGAAQPTAEATRGALEEIVVTASRREENIRDVPQTVTAMSGAEIASLGLSTAEDYSSFLPGLSFNRAGFADRAGLDLTVRGISNTRLTDASAGTGALTTGFYIDDVAVQPANIVAYDLQRIELLKGPQGTLFGQASMGGTLRFITNRPDARRFSAEVEATGSDTADGSGSWDLRGMLNMPLVDNQLALRVSAYSDHDGGYIDWFPTSL